MSRNDLTGPVHNAVYKQVKERGYATAVDVLMDLNYLSKYDYERWRNGQVDYLERVCKVNLKKLQSILNQMREYGKKANLKESFTYYKRWGRRGQEPVKLRFTKTGNPHLEERYATHLVSVGRKEKVDNAQSKKQQSVEKKAESGSEA